MQQRLENVAEHVSCGPVLDLGAGTGWITMHLSRWGHSVTAVDYSGEARAIFEENMRSVGLDITIAPADITALEFPEATFGSVVCYSVLEHIPDVQKAVNELARVTKPGGTVIAGVPNAWGLYSLLNDREPRRGFRRRPGSDVRCYHEQLHAPAWWKRTLERQFVVTGVIKLETFTPLLAKLWGYEKTAAWSVRDVRLADHLPRIMASDVIYICRKPGF
jgi:2-polyprenyl-3-methyl-5-hydroxy-6-metoxy-1,4-benzoquinol methylase